MDNKDTNQETTFQQPSEVSSLIAQAEGLTLDEKDSQQITEDQLPVLDRDTVKKMPLSLETIIEVLRIAFASIPTMNQQIVLAIGNTGAGKSTMITAYIDGPESLHETTIQREIKVGKGANAKTKIRPQKVIDVKEKDDNKFPIGHSTNKSMTFFPNIWNVKEKGYSFVDIAGLKDADGDLFEIINQMINKKIFSLSNGVKFVTVFTQNQIADSRGSNINQQVDVLLRVFQGSIKEISQSVKPIITRVDPKDQDFDLDTIRENIQEIIEMQAEQYLQQSLPSEIDLEKFKELFESQDPEFMNTYVKGKKNCDLQNLCTVWDDYQDRLKFAEDFAGAIDPFDPLERPLIGCGDEDQGISREQLVKQIENLTSIDGEKLFIPLGDREYSLVVKMFTDKMHHLDQIGVKFINEQCDGKIDSDQKFENLPEVQTLGEQIQFFKEHNLIKDIDNVIREFEAVKLSIQDNKLGMAVSQNIKDFIKRRKQMNYTSQVVIMSEIIDTVVHLLQREGLSSEKLREIKEVELQANKFIKQEVRAMLSDETDFFRFAYALRQHDAKKAVTKDFYTKYILKIVAEVDQLYKDILLSNHFIDGQMHVDPQFVYTFVIGKDVEKNILHKEEEIYAMKTQVLNKVGEQQADETQNKSLFGSFFSIISKIGKDALYGDLDSKRQGSLHFQFQLGFKGIYIISGDRRLITDGLVTDILGAKALMAAPSHRCYMMEESAQWILRRNPFDNKLEGECTYQIEQTYGEIKPRLLSKLENPQQTSWINIDRRLRRGYQNPEQSVLKIQRVGQNTKAENDQE